MHSKYLHSFLTLLKNDKQINQRGLQVQHLCVYNHLFSVAKKCLSTISDLLDFSNCRTTFIKANSREIWNPGLLIPITNGPELILNQLQFWTPSSEKKKKQLNFHQEKENQHYVQSVKQNADYILNPNKYKAMSNYVIRQFHFKTAHI